MKLKEPIEITQEELDILKSIKRKLLLQDSMLVMIGEVKTEKKLEQKVIKRWFKGVQVTTTERLLLTEIEIWGWNEKLSGWYSPSEDLLSFMLDCSDLLGDRQRYLNRINKPIEALNFRIVHKDSVINNNFDLDDEITKLNTPERYDSVNQKYNYSELDICQLFKKAGL